MLASIMSRPYATHGGTVLAGFCKSAGVVQWKAGDKVVQCLVRTKSIELILNKTKHQTKLGAFVNPDCFSDLDLKAISNGGSLYAGIDRVFYMQIVPTS